MSILQIEIPDETRARIEAQAQSEGRDAGSWLLEAGMKMLEAGREEEEAYQRYVESELLKALESGPGEVADDAWWKRLESDVLADIEGEKA